ncbi:MAG: hypothetical protein F4Y84_18525 [Caldilineaceae bacterium SB0665_bin_25]|nr:aspartyl protease family protein [Caldilineaceae bacterium]MXZ22562.1 hypothetical protein [Caldilineaceae bacterium SB0665_bin_25]
MTIVTFDYDSSFVPSAPVLEIEIDGYNRGMGKQRILALIDSGADATLIPTTILETVGATYKETGWMQGITGRRMEVDLYLTGIRVGTQFIEGVTVVGTTATIDPIIGRDVLNQLVVTLDGPGETTTIQRS